MSVIYIINTQTNKIVEELNNTFNSVTEFNEAKERRKKQNLGFPYDIANQQQIDSYLQELQATQIAQKANELIMAKTSGIQSVTNTANNKIDTILYSIRLNVLTLLLNNTDTDSQASCQTVRTNILSIQDSLKTAIDNINNATDADGVNNIVKNFTV